MSLGLMNKPIQICSLTTVKDTAGFNQKTQQILYQVRAYIEGRHGSEKWANLAAFGEVTEIFRLRKIPNFELTTQHYIICDNVRYDILSVENVKGRKMYIEVMAKKVVASNG